MEVEVVKKVKYDVKFLYVYFDEMDITEIDFDDSHIISESDGDLNAFVMYWSPLNAELFSDRYSGLCLKIDVDNGNVVNWPANVGGANFSNVKVVDGGIYVLTDSKNREVATELGVNIDNQYVPKCLQINDNGFGDYLEFTIDEDGNIKNWKFTQEDFDEILGVDKNC